MKRLIIATAFVSAIVAPASCTTITFGQEGISYTLSGGDVTLVPVCGVTTLAVTADQSSYNGKVTISELVDRIICKGNNTLFKRLNVLSPNITLEFPDAQSGAGSIVNTLFPGSVLPHVDVMLGTGNMLNVLGSYKMGKMTLKGQLKYG
ncbi:MAG: hypothetical protein LBF56_00865 [Holosporales bacterium]|jgi:hypothetical protein|nr:hypothetical protein [Holosporales bacterium]